MDHPLWQWQLLERFCSEHPYILIFAVICVLGVVQELWVRRTAPVNAPVAGATWWFEPYFITRQKYTFFAPQIINAAYKKWNASGSMYKVLRTDADLLVIPNKYIDEIKSLPEQKADPLAANISNLLGRYSTTDILLESSLHRDVAISRLIPNLGNLIAPIEDETRIALEAELPSSMDDWTKVTPWSVVVKSIARITARVFIGPPLCRDKSWLHASVTYVENLFMTVTILRLFPPMLHPIVSLFIPTYWGVRGNLRTAKRLVVPMILARRKAEETQPDYKKPLDYLQFMMDGAQGNDIKPEKLAQRQLLMALASIHTTAMVLTHVLYDLAGRPEEAEALREELRTAKKPDEEWTMKTLGSLRKMDSFFKESQRLNPPRLLSFHRLVMEPIKLSDGTVIPKGSHICMPAGPLARDPELVEDPEKFDPLRYANLRDQLPEAQQHMHQFASTDSNTLHFGHGRYGCPGRFFAAVELKAIVAQLLTKYDIKLADGQKRPQNVAIEDSIIPNPWATILFRERKGVC